MSRWPPEKPRQLANTISGSPSWFRSWIAWAVLCALSGYQTPPAYNSSFRCGRSMGPGLKKKNEFDPPLHAENERKLGTVAYHAGEGSGKGDEEWRLVWGVGSTPLSPALLARLMTLTSAPPSRDTTHVVGAPSLPLPLPESQQHSQAPSRVYALCRNRTLNSS